MWTIERVIAEFNTLCEADNLPVATCPINVNGRLTRTLGRVKYNRSTYLPIVVEFSRQLLEEGTDNDILNVIKHEYVHYFLLIATKADHGHDRVFKDKCKAIGCEHTGAYNTLESEAETKYKYEVWCANCGLVATYSRMGKVLKNLNACRCGKCKQNTLKMIQNW